MEEEKGGKKKREATDPKRLHIHRLRPIHNVCVSPAEPDCWQPSPRQDLVLLYSDPTPSSDGDFTAYKAAWVFLYPPARDMCSRKRHSFIHDRLWSRHTGRGYRSVLLPVRFPVRLKRKKLNVIAPRNLPRTPTFSDSPYLTRYFGPSHSVHRILTLNCVRPCPVLSKQGGLTKKKKVSLLLLP